MSKTPRKSLKHAISWWWQTRVLGLLRIRLGSSVKRQLAKPQQSIHFKNDAAELAPAKASGITVILTAYRRAKYLPDQIAALRAQTIPPDEIWVWSNRSEQELLDVSDLADRVVVSNSNYLFWGRFALANLVRTRYVAFFDDDVLPQPKWFESCLNTIAAGYDGILGGSGVILPPAGGYSNKNKAGWNGLHSNEVVAVDLVGHAWFMDKTHLKYMWFEQPLHWENGEDIHLSYMALKHGGIKTYVPPHPEHDQSIWSCRPDFGKVVGRMDVATSKTKDHRPLRTNIVDHYRADGWTIVSCLEQSNDTASH